MLHICLRVHRQSFTEPPFEEEILAFIRCLGHSAAIRTLTNVKHKNTKKSNEMYCPRFMKVIIHHFMSKDPSISRRNKVNGHYVRDDHMFSTIKLVSRHQNKQLFGALLPIELTNEEIKNSNAYKEYYAIATGAAPPKPKASVRRTRSSSNTSITPPTTAAGPRLTTTQKGKQVSRALKPNSLSALSEVAMTKAQQLKLATKRSRNQTHISHASGSGEDEGTGSIPGVPDVPTDESEEELSWNSTDDEGDADEGMMMKRMRVMMVKKEMDDEEEGGNDEHEYDDDESDEEIRDEDSFDPIPQTPKNSKDEGNGVEYLGLNVGGEERHVKEEEEDELYRDVNINQGRGLQASLEVEDSHVTLTLVNPDGQQQNSSVSSQFVTSMLNLTLDSYRLRDEAQRENEEFLKTVDENMQKIIKEQVKEQVKVQVSKILPRIEQAVNEQLESEVFTRSSHSSRTSYAVATDLSEMELKKIFIEKMKGNKSIQCSDEQRNLYKALVEAYEFDKIILDTYGETVTLKRRRDDDADKDEEPFARLDRGESALAEEPMQTTSQMEEPSHLEFDIGDEDQPIIQSSQHPEWFSQQQKPPSSDRAWNKTVPAVYGSIQLWISELAKQVDTRSSFNELMDTPLDFSNFLLNQLKVDTLTLEVLAGPTYELMKGLCKILVELEYHLEEVFKATIDQLDWVNPEGASSRKYTTSITKTKAANYGHIKWIEDLVPRTMWIEEPIGYDKHALWGVSYWGRKRQQFYGFTVNRESARDVYSKRRIIAITKLKIVESHSYKHLDWITIRRDDDKLYKFKEGDFKRLRIQDIKDMLLLLRKEAYTAYSNPRGFIYQNKDKRNRLIRIDELHKFSDGTLTDVRTALDDRLKGIWMQYLPQSIWRKSDKDRASAMIQAIDKRLKTRRIMRSLEQFVRGRLYEGDFRMLQRTI
uniref:Uncharacterized protein n=1 Tax=Tanacetum cinerariifolium TaxID=118510 RepID=A0A6L2LPA8_TANCI|nr:hypothetical protein [Tanacetum cinerariifolium]